MRWIRTINRVGMWFLIVVPVVGSGLNNVREQLRQGVDLIGWAIWLVGVFLWIALVRGFCEWLDRKLPAPRN